MANPNALSFRSFRIADEEAKRKRLEEKKQIELKEIAEKAAIQRALDEEQRRIETEQFRKKRNEHVTTRLSNAFGTKKKVEISEQEIENKLNKAFIPTKNFPEPFEEEPALNRELAEFKKKIHEHIAQLGLSHSSGGGAGSIADLDDIQISTAKVDGKVLQYSSSDGKWVGESVLTGAITGLDIDGGTDIGADLADADLIIVDDGAGGTNRKATLSRLKTYIGAGAADDLSAGDAAVTLTTTSGNITIDAAANNSDIIFKGTDGGSDITMLTLDGSAAGNAIFNANILIADGGTIGSASDADAITIDSSGNITASQNLTVSGDFTVSGTTTTVNKVTVNVEDAFIFEGATADAHETTFSVTDPTSDRVIVLPDTSGQVQVTPPITLNGTDGSSSNAGDHLVQDTSANANDRILYEDATTDPIAVLASHGITLSGQGWNAFQFDNG
jgi:hypothetical protein|tara:strand:+ start:134 stop:1468 length:1335 start_codon:yes stop_codon:yes gene_type:complete